MLHLFELRHEFPFYTCLTDVHNKYTYIKPQTYNKFEGNCQKIRKSPNHTSKWKFLYTKNTANKTKEMNVDYDC